MKVIIGLEYDLYGPDKKDLVSANKKLFDKENYIDIVYPYTINNLENLDINLTDKKIIITINGLDIEDNDRFIDNFYRNFSDAWGESNIEFGKKYFYYSKNTVKVKEEDLDKIEKYDHSYYVLGSVMLPENSVYKTRNCKVINTKNYVYFYKDIFLEKYRDEYYVSTNRLPLIFRELLKIRGNSYDYKLPKKYHKDIVSSYNYLECLSPKKYAGKVLMSIDKDIDRIFIRKDIVNGYRIGNDIIYKGKLNYIIFKNPLIGIY